MNHRAFLSDIIEHPTDDAPRLIYADWLDDQGDPARGEFIRVQCSLARLSEDDPVRPDLAVRESELLAEYSFAWAEPLRGLADKWAYRRGFIECVGLERDQLTVGLADLFNRVPVRDLRVEVGNFEPLCQEPRLRRLSVLGLFFDNDLESPSLRQFLESPGLESLTELYLDSELHDLLPQDDLEALGQSPRLADLTTLGLAIGDAPGDLEPSVIRAIADSPHLKQLRRLYLKFVDMDRELAGILATAPNFTNLTHLDLQGAEGSEEGWRELLDWPVLGRVQWLSLDGIAANTGNGESLRAEFRQRFGDVVVTETPADQILPCWKGFRWAQEQKGAGS